MARLRINDRVKSKNSGGQIQEEGKLVALIEAGFFLSHLCPKEQSPDYMWSRNYPKWKEELVAIVKFDKPLKTATLEEWVEDGMRKGLTREDLEKSYETCLSRDAVSFPISDLELA